MTPETSISAPVIDATSWEGDYHALKTGAGFRVMRDRILVEITGEDRVTFMHGMCSNEIQNLKADMIAYSLLLTEHAQVISDFYVAAEEDRLLLEIDRELWPRSREHLERFVIADDVEIRECQGPELIQIEGPLAGAAVAAAAGGFAPLPGPWQQVRTEMETIANLPRYGAPGFTLAIEESRAGTWLKGLTEAGAVEVGLASLETLRVEQGLPRVGLDTGDKTLALEARLEPAISFNKGCYLGQETVERATARGSLKKRLFGLKIAGRRAPERGVDVVLGGKQVGSVGSAVMSPRLGALALTIIHHSAWTVGTEVRVIDPMGELRATVSDLPFA